jgi:hypothetical protein
MLVFSIVVLMSDLRCVFNCLSTIGAYTVTPGLANYTIFPNSVPSQAAQPFGITSDFLSIPNPIRSGTAAFGLGADYNYFGLYWGSIDTYNTLSFWNDGSQVASFTGSQVAPSLQMVANLVLIPTATLTSFLQAVICTIRLD